MCRPRMARQRPRKTYLGAVQRAERQTGAERGEDGEGGHKHRRRYRRPPPRFSDLFVKKKEDKDEGDSSKENVIPSQTGGKVEGSFEQSQMSQAFRRLLTEINVTNSTTTSGPSFNDTFDKVFGRTGLAAKPQVPLQNPCSSSSESHLEGSGLLFKSLMSSASSWVADKSVWRGSRPTHNKNAQTQKKNKGMAEYNNNNNNNNNKSSSKEKTKQTSKPAVFSPQLFTSIDMVVADREDKEDVENKYEVSDNSPQSSPNSPPTAKARTLRWRTRRKQGAYRQMATNATSSHATKNKQKADSFKAAPVTELPTSHPQPPSVQPSPLVQRFLCSQGIVCPPPHQNSPIIPSSLTPPMDGDTVPPQITKSCSPYLSEKLSSKSSIHTSTPTERSRLITTSRKGSRWSASASPSLEMKLSPVPREEDMVTDNSSVFQSPSLATDVSKGQAQGESGGSPTLPSKYETCTSSGRLGREVSSSTSSQDFVTGETGDKGSRSPSYYNGSIRITHGPFKGARIPTLTFDSPSQQDTPPLHQDGVLQGSSSGANPLKMDTGEVSPIIKKRTRTQKGVKRLEKSSHNFSTKQIPKTTLRDRKTLPSWLAKRFSPAFTRSRSRLLGQLSDESHNTDQTHFENTMDKNDKAAEKGRKYGSNLYRGSESRRKSKRLASQKTESTLDTDDDKEPTMGSLPPLEESLVVEEKQPPRQTKRTSMVLRGGNRHSCGLPPIARRSVRSSRKINPTGVSVPRKRSTRLSSLIHKSQESSINRRSRKVDEEPSIKFSLSNCSSSPLRFHPRRGRRDNQLIFYRPDSSHSTTLTSVSSSPEVSLSHPPSDTFQHPEASPIRQLAFLSSSQHPAGTLGREGKVLSPEALQQTTREEGTGTVKESNWPRKMSSDGGGEAGAKECVFKQPLVLLRKLEESAHYSSTSNRSESVLPPLLPLPVKPGKGWRRSIAIRARAASLTALEQVTDMPPPRTPTSTTPVPPRRMSHLRMSSFPIELSPRLPPIGSTWLDSPRRSVLQMSFCSEGGEVAPPAPVPPDPRRQVLELCSQKDPLPFTQCFTDSRLASCRKIGEGVYGEVFMTQPNPASMEGARVLKVMPIEGNFPVNGEPQKKFEEILSEMVISLELSGLRAAERQLSITENFVHVQASWCVEGAYPQDLLHLWDLFEEEKGSENDRPDIFPDTQLYVVLEFGHGGRDLESFVFNNARDLMGVFLQIAYSLAVAEEALEFEHRDLHWGNVLVAPTSDAKINFKLSGETFTLSTYGLKATVIDFTLSRIKLPKCIVFNNLAEDPSLFTSEGDYQFEVYRMMQHTNNNNWETFKPYTNVLWLHYLLVKMTSECYIKNTSTKVHRSHHAQLMKMKDAMLSYESASHFLLSREEK